jgi:hypothetical protein
LAAAIYLMLEAAGRPFDSAKVLWMPAMIAVFALLCASFPIEIIGL